MTKLEEDKLEAKSNAKNKQVNYYSNLLKNKKLKKIGIIVARFQIDDLHTGHKSLIERAMGESDEVVIVLGCTTIKGDKANPLDFQVRKSMLQEQYLAINVWQQMDNKSDEQWSINLDKLICENLNTMYPGEEVAVTLHHSRDSFRSHYSGVYPCKEWDCLEDVSATERRKQIGESLNYDSAIDNGQAFRQGIIYSTQKNYDKVYPTVDCFVYNHKTDKALLGKRKNSNEWRLIGGFSDPTKTTGFKSDAQRELEEESGLVVPIGNFECIDSFVIDDFRMRSSNDKIVSTLFWVDVELEGDPGLGNDDIEEVKWFPARALFGAWSDYPINIAEEHKVLIDAAHTHYLHNIK